MQATTILGVKRGGEVALAGDGQVTQGDVVLKHGARKVRRLADGRALAGFAGAVADGLTLIGKFESQLKTGDGNLRRAAVELAKEWRTDRYLRRLEAQLLVADVHSLLLISGDGDVIEPDDGIVAIGSGSPYATAAAKALLAHTDLTARQIVESAMAIAAEICIFTNDRFSVESIGEGAEGAEGAEGVEEELPMPSPLAAAPVGDEDEEDEEDEERARKTEDDVDDDDDSDGDGLEAG
jgi:ATP-dependent HslUV protease subunit HslV